MHLRVCVGVGCGVCVYVQEGCVCREGVGVCAWGWCVCRGGCVGKSVGCVCVGKGV